MQIRKTKINISTGKTGRWLCAAIGLGLVWLLYSCTVPTYGKLQSSAEITRLFDDARILPDHLYYYSGMQGVPDAIIAMHPNYSLRTKIWQRVDLTSPTLKKWIDRMQYVHQVAPRGAWIVGPDGHRLGIWFSAQYQTVVRRDKDNRVQIVAPEPFDLRGVR